MLRDFLAQKRMDSDFENYNADALNETLRELNAAVQSTKAGGEYSIASLRSLRATIVIVKQFFNWTQCRN